LWMWSTDNNSSPGQTCTGQRGSTIRRPLRHTRPETHQNHIHL